jgi:ATP-dependent Clp protease ATP-binding subunit ClpC
MFERFDRQARRVVVLAQKEARTLNHNCIGTEHILLGLIHEGDGVAAQVLMKLGADLNQVRQQVIQLLQRPPASGSGQLFHP